MLSSLSIPGVRRLTALYATAELLDWCGSIALMLLVYGQTGSALSAGAMLICKQIVPGLLTPVAGRLLDRAPTVRVVAIGFAVQAGALLAVSAVGYGPALYALAVCSGLGGTLTRASFRATLARSLSGDARRAANALLNATMGLISLVGPGVGAVLATATSPQTALAATGAAGVLAAAFALAASRHPLGLAPAGSAAAKPGAAAAADAQVDDHTVAPQGERAPDPLPLPLPLLLALTAVISTGLAMDEPALLPYSEQSLDAGPGGYGAILSCWGLGIIVGSLAFSRVLHGRMIALAAGGTALSALGYLGLAAAPTIEVACVIAVIGGVGNGFNWVSLVTAVQEATPDDRQGQAASRLEAIITVGPALGYLLGGTIADAASPRLTLLIPGVLALAVLALGVALVAAKNRGRPPAAAPAGVDAAP